MKRDLRIDFLRGLVLLLIVCDHVLNNETSWFALADWVYFDAAACFVFISGLVCGMVYSSVLARHGFLATQQKALVRFAQLYIAQVIVLGVGIIAILIFRHYEPVDARPFGLQPMMDEPRTAIPQALLLSYTPWLMDILKLYMALLLVLPAMLWLYSKNRAGAIGLSAALYLFAQAVPEFSPREYPHGLPWFWNPFAWQFLFFIGVWLGAERRAGRLRLPRSPWLIGTAALGLTAIVLLCRNHALGYTIIDRQRLGLAQVLSFTIAAYLMAVLLRTHWRFWSSRIARPVVACGQHSLEVFCFGVIVDYVISLSLLPLHSPVAETAVVAAGVTATLLAGLAIERLKAGRTLPRPALLHPGPAAEPQVPQTARRFPRSVMRS